MLPPRGFNLSPCVTPVPLVLAVLVLADAHRSRLTSKWFQQPRQLAGSQLVRSPFVLWAAPVAKIIVLLGHSCSKNLALHAIEIPRIKDRLADIERTVLPASGRTRTSAGTLSQGFPRDGCVSP